MALFTIKKCSCFYRIIEYTPKKTAEGQDVYVFKISFLKDGADKHINHSEIFKDTQANTFFTLERSGATNYYFKQPARV